MGEVDQVCPANRRELGMGRKRVLTDLQRQENIRASNKRYYDKNRDKIIKKALEYHYAHLEDCLENVRSWRAKNKRYVRKYGKDSYQANREAVLLGRKEYYQNNKDKAAAHRAVARAIKSGKLVRGPCEVPGCKCKAAAHHDSYEPEHWLDVRWLCKSHHQRWHAEHPEEAV